MKNRKRERGFSLMELLIAMVVIAIIATLGFSQYTKVMAQAHYTKSGDTLRSISQGLDQYYLRHGRYPDFGSVEAMVDGGSPLVKQSLIAPNVSPRDGFGELFEGKSSKAGYELKCAGDPNDPDSRPPFAFRPGEIPNLTGAPQNQGGGGGAQTGGGAAGGGDKAPAPAGGGK
jgi:prepilin-type N-terminal cleavage/methylation domain-containing protein